MPGVRPRRARLTGWGRTNATVADVLDVPAHELAAAVSTADDRGALVRGLGRSYGDAAQNAGGLVLRLKGAAHQAMLHPDAAGGPTVTVPGGVSLDDLLRVIVPRGYFVYVTPGTRFVTVGGAIASDIHGKSHHVEGSFGNHVTELTLMLADGSTVVVGPDRQPDVFWATVGGMGLTGAILDATFRLLPIETSRMTVDTMRVGDLETLLDALTLPESDVRYCVAWIDCTAGGRHLGRGILERGDPAALAQLSPKDAANPLAYAPRQLVSVPMAVPGPGVINHATIRAFNEAWFRKAPARRSGEIKTIAGYFHPLDSVGAWNRLYGARGMVQYQFVVPFGAETALEQIIERLSTASDGSFLGVLKRFGPGNPAPLSFPELGWTLAVDLPAGSAGLGELLHSLDRTVLDAGGRHYFAKDSHTTAEAIRRGYPRLDEWKSVRDRLDPHGVWQSDLSRRLGLSA